jgi:hypothetical protein
MTGQSDLNNRGRSPLAVPNLALLHVSMDAHVRIHHVTVVAAIVEAIVLMIAMIDLVVAIVRLTQ